MALSKTRTNLAMTDPTARRRPQMLVLGVMIALGTLTFLGAAFVHYR